MRRLCIYKEHKTVICCDCSKNNFANDNDCSDSELGKF